MQIPNIKFLLDCGLENIFITPDGAGAGTYIGPWLRLWGLQPPLNQKLGGKCNETRQKGKEKRENSFISYMSYKYFFLFSFFYYITYIYLIKMFIHVYGVNNQDIPPSPLDSRPLSHPFPLQITTSLQILKFAETLWYSIV